MHAEQVSRRPRVRDTFGPETEADLGNARIPRILPLNAAYVVPMPFLPCDFGDELVAVAIRIRRPELKSTPAPVLQLVSYTRKLTMTHDQ